MGKEMEFNSVPSWQVFSSRGLLAIQKLIACLSLRAFLVFAAIFPTHFANAEPSTGRGGPSIDGAYIVDVQKYCQDPDFLTKALKAFDCETSLGFLDCGIPAGVAGGLLGAHIGRLEGSITTSAMRDSIEQLNEFLKLDEKVVSLQERMKRSEGFKQRISKGALEPKGNEKVAENIDPDLDEALRKGEVLAGTQEKSLKKELEALEEKRARAMTTFNNSLSGYEAQSIFSLEDLFPNSGDQNARNRAAARATVKKAGKKIRSGTTKTALIGTAFGSTGAITINYLWDKIEPEKQCKVSKAAGEHINLVFDKNTRSCQAYFKPGNETEILQMQSTVRGKLLKDNPILCEALVKSITSRKNLYESVHLLEPIACKEQKIGSVQMGANVEADGKRFSIELVRSKRDHLKIKTFIATAAAKAPVEWNYSITDDKITSVDVPKLNGWDKRATDRKSIAYFNSVPPFLTKGKEIEDFNNEEFIDQTLVTQLDGIKSSVPGLMVLCDLYLAKSKQGQDDSPNKEPAK